MKRYPEENQTIVKFINKSILLVNIQHEFGHTHRTFLFFINYNNISFDSPLVKLKLKQDDDFIDIEEGGHLFEYLLYNRIVDDVNLKEAVYINNINNYSKSLNDFRNGFIELDKISLENVLKDQSNNNEEILNIYNVYKQLSKNEKIKLESMRWKHGARKIVRDKIDYEYMTFGYGCLRKPHDKKIKENI